jgi:hypothetical protein
LLLQKHGIILPRVGFGDSPTRGGQGYQTPPSTYAAERRRFGNDAPGCGDPVTGRSTRGGQN